MQYHEECSHEEDVGSSPAHTAHIDPLWSNPCSLGKQFLIVTLQLDP